MSIDLVQAIAVPGWAGSLMAWGYDDYGQVSNTPAGDDFVVVSVGTYHNVVLKSNGSLISWGRDDHGQVSSSPVGNDFIAITAGGHHTVTLKSRRRGVMRNSTLSDAIRDGRKDASL